MKLALSLLAFLVASASAFSPLPVKQLVNSAASSASSSSLNLAVGKVAPDFSLPDQNGKIVTRSQIKKPLVVFFYPADASPGCTIQADTFNKRIQQIRSKYGAEVVGISGQDVNSKAKFAKGLGLNFSILADSKGDATRKAFDVPRAALGLLPGRVTYVLDAQGVCQAVYNDIADAAGHADFAEKALAELKPSKPSKGKALFSF
ncbi:hypothetical protein ACA910_013506 [Epithemia clementina (nom. ined.)]